jgi:hypothetical protein
MERKTTSIVAESPNPPAAVSGIGASLAEYNNRSNQKLTKAQMAEEKRRERQVKKETERAWRSNYRRSARIKSEKTRRSRRRRRKSINKKTKKTQKAKPKEEESEEGDEHVIESGSGRPRSMSDPNLRTSIDSDGLLEVERPDGWVGAYSPDSRKMRIERFLAKRNHRVWTKSVKYDVRKNFA